MPKVELAVQNPSSAMSDAKEFSMEGPESGLSVPCKPPPCRGCKPCVSCNPCRGAINTDVPIAKSLTGSK